MSTLSNRTSAPGIPHQNGNTVDYFMADIRQSTDYSGFGVQLQERNLSLSGNGVKPYRYGFHSLPRHFGGQEFDSETGLVNFEYRMHDPRLGRFFAIDPIAKDYSWNSPYAFSENQVIHAVELEGLEKINKFYYNYETQSFPKQADQKEVNSSLDKNVNMYIYGYPNGGVKRTVVKSWDGEKVASSQGSMDQSVLRSNFSTPSISASKSADKTHYDSMEEHGPFKAVSLGVSTEINYMLAGGVGYEAKVTEGGGSKIEKESEVTKNILYLSSNSGVAEANAQISLDFATTKGYNDDNAYTIESEISYNIGILSLSIYKNSDGDSGFRVSLGVSTSKSKIPVSATAKVKEN